MKCPECVKEGKKSNVYPGMGTTTLAYCPPYYDNDGTYHHHDTNRTTMDYSCSKGHNWIESVRPHCPAPNCNWNERLQQNGGARIPDKNEIQVRFLVVAPHGRVSSMVERRVVASETRVQFSYLTP